MPKRKNYPGYPGGGVVGLRGRIPGYQETDEVQGNMFQRLLKRIGGWDNRLRGEEEAQGLHELRQLMDAREQEKYWDVEGAYRDLEPQEPWPGYVRKYRGHDTPEEMFESGDPLSRWWTERGTGAGKGKVIQDWTDKDFEERHWPGPYDEIHEIPEMAEAQKLSRRAREIRRLMHEGPLNKERFPGLYEPMEPVPLPEPGRYEQSLRRASADELLSGKPSLEALKNSLLIRGRASGGIIGLAEGGGAGMAPGQSQVTSYGVPQQTEQQWANLTDRIVTEGQRPYQQYGGPRMAGFTAPEAAAMAGRVAYGQGVGPQGTIQAGQTLGQAAQGISGLIPQQQALGQQAQLQGQLAGAGMRATGAAAQAEQQALGAGQAAAGQAGQVQMTGLGQQMGTAGQAALGAQQQFGTGMTGLGAGAATAAQTRETAAAGLGQQAQQAGAAGQAQMAGMGTAAQQLGQTAMGQMGQTGVQSQAQAQQAAQRMRDIGGQAPQLQKGADMSDYMSQYTAGVTDPQLQQLMEFQKMQGQELGSAAAQSGAFGGSRADIEQRKLREQTGQKAAEIIGTGQQKAFESAQQAFQADRAAQQQAQQTGLSAEQQAAATQAGAQGQALAAQQAGVGAAQAGGAQQMQAAQQGMAAGQQGRDAQMRAMQMGIGAGQYGSDAQMRAQQQAAAMGQAGAGALQQGLAGQGALTAQGIGMGQQGLAAQQAAASTGAGLGLQGQQQGFQAAQAGIQQRMGAQQAAMGGYGQLAGVGGQQLQLGGQQQAQQLERLRDVQGVGAEQRAMQDRSLGIGYQDWQNRQNQERQNIGWQQQAMSGLPYQGSVTQTAYGVPRSGGADLLATGIGGMGAYNAFMNTQEQQPSYQATSGHERILQANPVAQVTPFQGTPITPMTVGNPAMQNYQATQQNPVAQVTPFQGTSITPKFRGGRVW